jgi:hypothetical protein
MTQEPQKNNTVLILIAIIGVLGTIVATTIGVIGNYNIEKFRQESELTRVALVSIVTQGGKTQVSMAGTISAPTITPYPTASPFPKDTSTPRPTPTYTSIPTQTPDFRLFWDDFQNGVKPEWNMQGEYSAVNGKLRPGKSMQGYLGDQSWIDYAIVLTKVENSCGDWGVMLRMYDRDNYMLVKLGWGCVGNPQRFDFYKIVNGKEQKIAGAGGGKWYADGGSVLRIEVEGDVYRFYQDNERIVYFTDNTFSSGGVSVVNFSSESLVIDDFEIDSLR